MDTLNTLRNKFNTVLNDIRSGKSDVQKAEEKEEALVLNREEELYIGNLHCLSAHHANGHWWTMFVSTSPTDVVPPRSILSVTYYLHPSFRPSVITVDQPPFLLTRRGWGYFTVKAVIAFHAQSKKDVQSEDIPFRTSHSIHFGSPIVAHNIFTDMPYICDSTSLQQNIKERAEERHMQRVLRQKLKLRKVQNEHKNSENSDTAMLLKKMEERSDGSKPFGIPEIKLTGFTMTLQQMRQTLGGVGQTIPSEILDVIAGYTTLCSLDGDADVMSQTRVVIEDCYACQFAISQSVLEVVIRRCGGCQFQTLNVDRMIRCYSCKTTNLYTKGECTSYRMERCDEVNVQALDTHKRCIFMSLLSQQLSFKMFNAYYPGDASKCVAEFRGDCDSEDEEGKNDAVEADMTAHFVAVFRRERNIAAFTKHKISVSKEASLIRAIGE